jgi:hypothetical protein
MPVMYVLDFAEGTLDGYERVIERMQLNGRLPEGALFHAAGAHGGGVRVIDVWETSDGFQRFAQEQIAPHSAAEGFSPPDMKRYEVTQLRRGSDQDVGFLQLVFIPGIDRATFEDVDRRVLGDAGVPQEIVFHVNGPTDDGQYVMDAWPSKEDRDRFAESNIKPAIQAAGLTAMPEFQDMAVHNTLRHGASTERATA